MKFSICERVNREWHWIGSDRGALASALEARWGTIYNVNVSANGMYNINVSANGMYGTMYIYVPAKGMLYNIEPWDIVM